MCHMTHSYVLHDSLTCVRALVQQVIGHTRNINTLQLTATHCNRALVQQVIGHTCNVNTLFLDLESRCEEVC